ncbi:MAG: hypothetical protein ACYC9O_06525, partial [Candidatus Latescibacterota bacterium]
MNYIRIIYKSLASLGIILMAALFLPGCGKQSEKTGSTVTPADSSHAGLNAGQTVKPNTISASDTIPLDSPDVPPSGEHSPLWIAVARSDGVLFPFAMYDNGKWTNPWPNDDLPEPVSPGDITVTTISDIPAEWCAPLPKVPREWYLLKPGGYAGTMRVERPAAVYEHCFRRWGLVCRYSPNLEDIRKHNPINKIGIALSETQAELKAEKLDENSEIERK